ncbi:hypothetical protein PMI17_00469 [Pantoea sp. GM01]|nr:hypothetical protein PMI17_00469 [Pantoea sp. GM01]
MQERHIEFRYFPDGNPAFADVLDERFFFYKGLLDAEVKYYSYNQVMALVSLAYAVTYGSKI